MHVFNFLFYFAILFRPSNLFCHFFIFFNFFFRPSILFRPSFSPFYFVLSFLIFKTQTVLPPLFRHSNFHFQIQVHFHLSITCYIQPYSRLISHVDAYTTQQHCILLTTHSTHPIYSTHRLTDSLDFLNLFDSQRLTTTHNDSQRLTTTHNDSQRLTTTHNNSLDFPNLFDSQRLTTTHNDSQRLTTTHNDSQRLTTTHENFFSSFHHFIRNYSHLFYLSYFIFILF